MATSITPRLGKIVHYALTEADVREIIQNRQNAGRAAARGNEVREGDVFPAMIVADWVAQSLEEYTRITRERLSDEDSSWARGELSKAGILHPKSSPIAFNMLVEQMATEGHTKAVEMASQNLQVFLDGTDVFWATSRTKFEPTQHGRIDKDAPGLALLGHADDAPRAEIELVQQQNDRAGREYRQKWWREDRKGHWTEIPAAW